jgi:hypothetical protein
MFQIISTAIARIWSSVQYVKSTPGHKHKFQEAIATARIPTQALPSTDVATRWNLTYLMLKSALPYREAFSFLSIQDLGYTHCPTDKEWEEMPAMKDFLSIFNSGMCSLTMFKFYFSRVRTNQSIYFKLWRNIELRNDTSTYRTCSVQKHDQDWESSQRSCQ